MGFKFIRTSGVPLLPLFATFWATADPKIIKILIYGYHILLGVNSYVYDDDTSIKIYFIFIRSSGVPFFATFWVTAEPKFIEIIIYGYHIMHTLLSVNSYVFDDEKPIKKSSCKFILSSYLVCLFFATFQATAESKLKWIRPKSKFVTNITW